MELSFIILEQTIMLFLIMIVGVICYKTKIITKEGNKQLSDIMMKIVMPAMVFNAYQTADYSTKLLTGLGQGFILSLVFFVITIPVSMIIFRKSDKYEYSIERFSTIYTNCAFMGFPLIDGIFGAEGILYTTSFVTLFNIFVWTHGIMVMKNEVSFKSFLNALKSPALIAVVVGIICYLFRLTIHSVPLSAIGFVASMNTPLAMIIAGATIAQTNILKTLKKARIYLVTIVRLLIIPFIMVFVMKLFGVSNTVYVSIVIASSCPTATIGTLFAIKYDKNAIYASEIFAVTTLLSAISLPLIVYVSQMI